MNWITEPTTPEERIKSALFIRSRREHSSASEQAAKYAADYGIPVMFAEIAAAEVDRLRRDMDAGIADWIKANNPPATVVEYIMGEIPDVDITAEEYCLRRVADYNGDLRRAASARMSEFGSACGGSYSKID